MTDAEALDFETRILKLKDKIYLSALTILKNEEDAKDVLQETVYIAYMKRKQLKQEEAFDAWVAKIALREAYRLYRRQKKRAAVETELTDHIFCPETSQKDIEFFSIIASLNSKEQAVLILYFYHDQTLEEISRQLRLPLSTVKSRLYRATAKIQRQWEEGQ